MLKKGELAPYFELPDQDGKITSLSEYKGKWLVLYFYPKDNTPGCTNQALEFTNLRNDFDALGVEVLGMNGDSVESHQNFYTKHNLTVRLLSDTSKLVLSSYKVWGEKKFMDKVYEGLIRSTFIIDPNGNLEEVMYNVKAKNHGSRVLRTMKQILGA